MRTSDFLLIVSGVLSMTMAASAATRYVNLNNPAPFAPYTSWGTAATNIQTAVDAAAAGDEIVVTNGTYASGGRVVYGIMTNRVAIDKAVTVRSVNGPAVTIIEGQRAPGSTNGDGAIRCVYVGTNAVLSGFTLTNGHTRDLGDMLREQRGGGAWCEPSGLITNCTLIGNSAYDDGGGTWFGILNNCTLLENSAYYGGGACFGTLNNCTLSGNSAYHSGGGAEFGTLNNCTLTGNSAYNGGGAYSATLYNCILSGNSAGYDGGGAFSGDLNNCTLSSNSAAHDGGGAWSGKLNNCTLSGNSAAHDGGGVHSGRLNNCTLSGNSAGHDGGGAYSAWLNNCIVYYNTAPNGPNYDNSFSELKYSCTVPLPVGLGNIDAEPLLASTSHLLAQSPCIGRGSSNFTSGVDIDGEQWLDPPCMGADQFVPGQTTGALAPAIEAAYTNVASGFAVSLTALIQGKVTGSVWDFGDGTAVGNRVYVSHAWATPGLYTVRLTGYNDSWPGGVSTTLQVRVEPRETYYVNVGNMTPAYPYTNWAGAAVNIQDAIDAGTQVGRLVLVGDGVYKTGGRAVYGTMTNRVVVTEGVEVRSLNGPMVTTIEGQMAPDWTYVSGAIRCVYVGTNAVLSGFTLTNGYTRASGDNYKEQSGGGAWCEVSGTLTNCVLKGNSAESSGGGVCSGVINNCNLSGNSASYGGGSYGALLNYCILTGNSADMGGGASTGILNNCALNGNFASNNGGGANWSALNNCILSGNSTESYGGGAYSGTLNNCSLTGNLAEYGGGAYSGTLNNCTLSGNWAKSCGGGANKSTLNNSTLIGNSSDLGGGGCNGTLNNCTLTGNSAAHDGGGVHSATLTNCIVHYNVAPNGPNFYGSASKFSYCCSMPLPPGLGNIEAAPGFVDTNGWSNLRLQANSPCINAGGRGYASMPSDLDGSPRVVGGTVDMGAYEFQSPSSIISYGWLQQYGFSIDGQADLKDSDVDGLDNWQEWIAGTNPTNSSSALRMLAVQPAVSTTKGVTVSWTSVTNRTYCLERALILGAVPGFGVVRSNLYGRVNTTTFNDTSATAPGPFFYRVRVEN